MQRHIPGHAEFACSTDSCFMAQSHFNVTVNSRDSISWNGHVVSLCVHFARCFSHRVLCDELANRECAVAAFTLSTIKDGLPQ